MECVWASGPLTGGQILATLRLKRTIAPTTVTTTLARLYDQGLLTRELAAGRKMPWRYTARCWPALSSSCVCSWVRIAATGLAVLLGTPR